MPFIIFHGYGAAKDTCLFQLDDLFVNEVIKKLSQVTILHNHFITHPSIFVCISISVSLKSIVPASAMIVSS